MAAVAEDDAGQQAMTETEASPEQEQAVARQTTIRVLIKSSGGKVNIRTGNGTSYSRITRRRTRHSAGVCCQRFQRLAGGEDRKPGRMGFRGVQRNHN